MQYTNVASSKLKVIVTRKAAVKTTKYLTEEFAL